MANLYFLFTGLAITPTLQGLPATTGYNITDENSDTNYPEFLECVFQKFGIIRVFASGYVLILAREHTNCQRVVDNTYFNDCTGQNLPTQYGFRKGIF